MGNTSTINTVTRKPSFIIWTPDYTELSGGCVELANLADRLSKRGYECFMYPGKVKDELKSLPLDWSATYNLGNFIVIYPEVVSGNPLNAPNVVHWVLQTPGTFGIDMQVQRSDLVFYWSEWFFENRPDKSLRFDGWLRATRFGQLNYFQNFFSKYRHGCCVLKRKFKGEVAHEHADLPCIDKYGSLEELRLLLNKYQVLFSYDSCTLISQMAALCGCVSIVIPTPCTSHTQWLQYMGLLANGVAYGVTDLTRAIETQYLLRGGLKTLDEAVEIGIAGFLYKVTKRFGFTL